MPDNRTAALLSEGVSLQEKCRWKDSEDFFHQAVNREPASAALRLKLWESLIQQGKSGGVEEAVLPVLSLTSSDGPERFRALVALQRHSEAFAEGEALLARDRSPGLIAVLGWPWGLVWPDQGGARGYFLARMAAFEEAGRRGSPWAVFYTGILKRRAQGDPSWPEHLQGVARFPSERYGWMLFELGRARLFKSDFEGALESFQRYLSFTTPKDWIAYAYAGEAHACQGRRGAAMDDFRAAVGAAPGAQKGGALAWMGAVLLWFDLSEQALSVLDKAAALGARYSFCSRAVAKIRLGDLQGALPDLRKAIELKPWDEEAWVWLGEVKRLMGEPREAIEVLDGVIERNKNVWAYWNRALAHAAVGDHRGMRADFQMILEMAAPAVEYIRGRLGLRPGAAPAQDDILAVLREGLGLNRVIRKGLGYKAAVWMR